MILEALKELNIHEIEDLFTENEPPDMPFEEKCVPPPQYYPRLTQGDVKERQWHIHCNLILVVVNSKISVYSLNLV